MHQSSSPTPVLIPDSSASANMFNNPDITLPPLSSTRIPIGLSCAIPQGLYMRIACCSNLAIQDVSIEGGVINNEKQRTAGIRQIGLKLYHVDTKSQLPSRSPSQSTFNSKIPSNNQRSTPLHNNQPSGKLIGLSRKRSSSPATN